MKRMTVNRIRRYEKRKLQYTLNSTFGTREWVHNGLFSGDREGSVIEFLNDFKLDKVKLKNLYEN